MIVLSLVVGTKVANDYEKKADISQKQEEKPFSEIKENIPVKDDSKIIKNKPLESKSIVFDKDLALKVFENSFKDDLKKKYISYDLECSIMRRVYSVGAKYINLDGYFRGKNKEGKEGIFHYEYLVSTENSFFIEKNDDDYKVLSSIDLTEYTLENYFIDPEFKEKGKILKELQYLNESTADKNNQKNNYKDVYLSGITTAIMTIKETAVDQDFIDALNYLEKSLTDFKENDDLKNRKYIFKVIKTARDKIKLRKEPIPDHKRLNDFITIM